MEKTALTPNSRSNLFQRLWRTNVNKLAGPLVPAKAANCVSSRSLLILETWLLLDHLRYLPIYLHTHTIPPMTITRYIQGVVFLKHAVDSDFFVFSYQVTNSITYLLTYLHFFCFLRNFSSMIGSLTAKHNSTVEVHFNDFIIWML